MSRTVEIFELVGTPYYMQPNVIGYFVRPSIESLKVPDKSEVVYYSNPTKPHQECNYCGRSMQGYKKWIDPVSVTLRAVEERTGQDTVMTVRTIGLSQCSLCKNVYEPVPLEVVPRELVTRTSLRVCQHCGGIHEGSGACQGCGSRESTPYNHVAKHR